MAKKEDKIPEDIDSELKAPKFGKADTHTTTGYFLDVNEKLPVCEDYDMWLRICHKYPVLFIEEALTNK